MQLYCLERQVHFAFRLLDYRNFFAASKVHQVTVPVETGDYFTQTKIPSFCMKCNLNVALSGPYDFRDVIKMQTELRNPVTKMTLNLAKCRYINQKYGCTPNKIVIWTSVTIRLLKSEVCVPLGSM